MKQSVSGRVRLRDFELDLKTGKLCSGDDSRTLLREQPFQVLRMLVANGGEIVTREEIQRTLWPGSTIVDFDHSINVAIGILRKALGDSANNPHYISHFFWSETYVMKGRAQDALAEIEGERNDAYRLQIYAIAYHALAREKESDAALKELIEKYHTVSAFQIAEVYAFRNQPDEAFEWLERAYAQRDGDLPVTNIDPLLKSLHNDPRYAAFLKKIHLPT